jgi:hypothetical protein
MRNLDPRVTDERSQFRFCKEHNLYYSQNLEKFEEHKNCDTYALQENEVAFYLNSRKRIIASWRNFRMEVGS